MDTFCSEEARSGVCCRTKYHSRTRKGKVIQTAKLRQKVLKSNRK